MALTRSFTTNIDSKSETCQDKPVHSFHWISNKGTNPEIIGASTGIMTRVIETTSPLSPAGEEITTASNVKSFIIPDNLSVDRDELFGVTKEEENIQRETKRLWDWCKSILMDFAMKPEADGFLEPVDWKKLKLPLYPNIIKKPMDLGTIKSKLDLSEYSSIFQLDKDMRLVWGNAKKFNQPGSKIYKSAEFLRREWSRIFWKSRKEGPGCS